MQSKKYGFWLGLSLLLGLWGPEVEAAECNKVVLSADPEYPPLHWYDGQTLRGASIDIATKVLGDLHLPYEVRYLGPWARVLATAQAGQIDMVVTLKNTPERQQYLLFTSTPALSNPIAVFVAKQRPLVYRNWASLMGYRGGISRGNVFGGGFDEFMRTHLQVEEANDVSANFSKLRRGHIDYFITGRTTGVAALQRSGQTDSFRLLEPMVVDSLNYVAFVKSSPCSKYQAQFDRRLAELLRDGTLNQLLQSNIQAWAQGQQGPL